MTVLNDEDPADPSVHEPRAMTYTTRVTALTVAPDGERTYSELASVVRIDDEGAGEFVVVEQTNQSEEGKFKVNPEEWPTLRDAIDKMIAACRD